LTGRAGIHLAESVDYCLRVPAEDTTRIQEAHMLVGHTLFELVEQDLVEQYRSSAVRRHGTGVSGSVLPGNRWY
jgi:hypothetical protein